ALLGAITSNLSAFVQHRDHLEASVITFIATASGMSFLGLGSAFWGVAIGALAYSILHRPAGAKTRQGEAATTRRAP
ncbi:MAG TPA: benzoate/H(+) symporter BenE family transporter, partial [Halomonas sp.]|nr:benzoate/H(+) symporter BenE family transporter [Halomonas sp.]